MKTKMKPLILISLLAALCGCDSRKLQEAQQIHVLLLDRMAAQADEIKRQSNVIRIYKADYERAMATFRSCDDEPPYNGIHTSNFEPRIGFMLRKPCVLTNDDRQEIWVTWTNSGFMVEWFGKTNFYPINP